MRRVISLVLVVALAAFVSPVPVIAQGNTGTVNGTAVDASKNPLPKHTVRIRNLTTGQTTTTTSAGNGAFSFAGVNPGNYVIEVLNSANQVIAMSSTVAVAAGATATITVTAAAITGAAAAAGAGAGGLAALFSGTSLLVVTGAGLVGLAIAVAATKDKASPSR